MVAGLLRLTFISPLGFISPLRLARALHSSVRVTRRDKRLRPYRRGGLKERPSAHPQADDAGDPINRDAGDAAIGWGSSAAPYGPPYHQAPGSHHRAVLALATGADPGGRLVGALPTHAAMSQGRESKPPRPRSNGRELVRAD